METSLSEPKPDVPPAPAASAEKLIACKLCGNTIGHDEEIDRFIWHISPEGHKVLSGFLRCPVCGFQTFVKFSPLKRVYYFRSM